MMRRVVGAIRLVASAAVSIFFATIVLLVHPIARNERIFHAIARGWAHVILFVAGVRVRVRGLEKLDLTRSYIYVSNHASMFDIPVIVKGIPDQIRIVYKKELERIPIFGWGLKIGAYIGIDRRGGSDAAKSLEEAAEKIRNGASVLLYAEGTRTLDGRLQAFRRGAFHLAVKAGVPVVPLTVNGSFSILRKHSLVVHPGDVELILETPIEVPVGGRKEDERRLMEEVHTAITRHYIDQ